METSGQLALMKWSEAKLSGKEFAKPHAAIVHVKDKLEQLDLVAGETRHSDRNSSWRGTKAKALIAMTLALDMDGYMQ